MFVPGLCHCNKIAQKKVEFQALEWHRLRKKNSAVAGRKTDV
jgi:hypothetical protein